MAVRRTRRHNRQGGTWFLARVLLVLCVFAAFLFGTVLVSAELLPVRVLIAAGAFLLVLLALLALLTWWPEYRARYALGLVLTVAVTAGLALGTGFLYQGIRTARNVTALRTHTADVGIYVLDYNEAAFAENAASLNYGVLDTIDRDNTDEAILEIDREYGIPMALTTYEGLPQLITALFACDVDAIVINSAYIPLLEEMEGYEEAADYLREVHMSHVERTVTPQPAPEPLEPVTLEAPEDGDNLVAAPVRRSAVEPPVQSDDGAFTVFVSGIDTRGALTAESRSDANILAAVNPRTRQVVLISTPRDYYVPLSISGGVRDKLTHAGIYGVNVCMDTMAMLYDVDVDYYFRVNFAGFEEIIDALGGITVESDQAFTSVDGYRYQAGYNSMDGAAALSFVRERSAFASGDRQRGWNQLGMMDAVIEKVLSPELLRSYSDILSSVEGSFETSVPYDMISSLVRDQLNDGGSWNIVKYSVDGTAGEEIPYSMSQYAYVMIPDETTVDTARDLIRQVLSGQQVTNP